MKFIRAKNLHSKEIYHFEFKKYKSMINRLTRINKSKYFKIFFREYKTNSKQTWEAVRSLINVKITSNKQITSPNINNQIETRHPPLDQAFPLFKIFVSLPLFSVPPPFKVFQTVLPTLTQPLPALI